MLSRIIVTAIFSFASLANAAVVTLYYVDKNGGTSAAPTPTDDISIELADETKYSYIGPAQETGVTQYGVEHVVNRYVFHGNDVNPTVTVISEPVTRTWVLEQGASVHRENSPGFHTAAGAEGQPFWIQGFKENCKFDMEKKEGVCVDELELPVVTPIATQDSQTVFSTFTSTIGTTTFTGPLVPLATVTTSGASSKLMPSMMTLGSMFTTMAVFLAVKSL
ncbi:hypothetical protein CVT24_002857 [Panaeolus cyanescens]|uniref:Uncharacterized protein n=1 Tax=Panaeolus cyanescens TaxID=181874 RepID=A0A409VN39_9AGAR|nr:hypothetical protein CVT24_002857 [Panaeolus cyanescens]